jgi:hypothetical protein
MCCNLPSLLKASPLLGPSGLQTGDKILALNQCEVKDFDTWYHCIVSAVNHPTPGYCVSSELLKEHDESTVGKEFVLSSVIVHGYYTLLKGLILNKLIVLQKL